jgi:hypothetical protein
VSRIHEFNFGIYRFRNMEVKFRGSAPVPLFGPSISGSLGGHYEYMKVILHTFVDPDRKRFQVVQRT